MPSLSILTLLVLLFALCTPVLSVSFQDLPDNVKEKIFTFVVNEVPPVRNVTNALRVCKNWYTIIFGPLLLAITILDNNRKFHRFIRVPTTRVQMSSHIRKLDLHIWTGFDFKRMEEPLEIRELRAANEPSYNEDKIIDDYMEPYKKWRLDLGKAFDKDFNQLEKVIANLRAFPNLQNFSCFVDKKPPSDYRRKPASVPINVQKVFKVGWALEVTHGFVVDCEEDDAEHTKVVAHKIPDDEIPLAKLRLMESRERLLRWLTS